MTTAASGEMSLGGNTDATRSVACELDIGGTTQISMNDAVVRTLAATSSGAISFCNFYSKTAAPAGLGCFFKGGYYTGSVSSPSQYYLLVAPNAVGCGCCSFIVGDPVFPASRPTPGACDSSNDGFLNTYCALTNNNFPQHPAGKFTATRSICGFSDYYLPADNELSLMRNNRACLPAGERYFDGAGATSSIGYWTSRTHPGPGSYGMKAFANRFCDNSFYALFKTYSLKARAIRRFPF